MDDKKKWRTLVHVLDVQDKMAIVVFPAWKDEEIAIPVKDFPQNIRQKVETNFRCYAKVCLYTDEALDLNPSDWEFGLLCSLCGRGCFSSDSNDRSILVCDHCGWRHA